jgi:anti-sigma regulatory factor (Ser/Thr protein kinase)
MREVYDLPEKEGRSAGIACGEILLNAMEHGGKFDPEECVEISYVRTRKMATCRIEGPGAEIFAGRAKAFRDRESC